MADFEVKDFQTDVIEASARIPVLVDFWAPWCGPCKMLGPVLEKAADAAGGRWKLVKINTEEHLTLASEYGIASIPNVKLFHHGRVINEFLGFLPEPELQRWLDAALPSPHAQAVDQARECLVAGKSGDAATLLEPVVAAEPANQQARFLLAWATLSAEPERATQLIADIHEDSDLFTQAAALRELAAVSSTPIATLPEGRGRTGYAAARSALKSHDYAGTLDGVMASLEESGQYAEGAAARLGKAMVKLLGVRHPVVDARYRRLSSLLHS